MALSGWLTLGAVFLVVTGAEALYADLGHFGPGPIRTAWFTVALPALTINYLGQGALLLANPKAIENPFFLLYPEWALLPMIVLATAATVIASQAVISGAYSLTRQAIQLGLLPRLEIRHTSEAQFGQIYMPRVNTLLLLGVLLLVVLFKSSGALASAYGIAVTGTMVVTAILALIVIWRVWNWPLWAAAALMVPFLLIDLVFLGANLLKVFQGGWVPLLIGAMIIVVMLTWRRGRADSGGQDAAPGDADRRPDRESREKASSAGCRARRSSSPRIRTARRPPCCTVSSTTRRCTSATSILTMITETTPRVSAADRVSIEPLGGSFQRVLLRFGFMETPNVPKALGLARKEGLSFDIMSTSFFLSRRSVRPDARSACRYGKTAYSFFWRGTPTTHRAISSFLLIGWSRSERRWRSKRSMAPLNSDTQALAPPNGEIAEAREALLGADLRLDRRRLWRHRHEPPLRLARSGARGHRRDGAVTPERGVRHAVAHLLVADRRRHAQICADPAARRQ